MVSYDEMVDFIRSLFDLALKTNDSLEFGVLTGCLRISKESIFTGMNNLNVNSISEVQFSRIFRLYRRGSTGNAELLWSGTVSSIAKQWYDGYHFGRTEMYCPWDIAKYCNSLIYNPDAEPQAYWLNTSGNDIIRQFVSSATATMKFEIGQLIAGEVIAKKINQELTYRDFHEGRNILKS